VGYRGHQYTLTQTNHHASTVVVLIFYEQSTSLLRGCDDSESFSMIILRVSKKASTFKVLLNQTFKTLTKFLKISN